MYGLVGLLDCSGYGQQKYVSNFVTANGTCPWVQLLEDHDEMMRYSVQCLIFKARNRNVAFEGYPEKSIVDVLTRDRLFMSPAIHVI